MENSKTFLSQVEGFTPVIDALAAELGVTTALVYGIAWRYCQLDDKVCSASKEEIARHAGISDKTVQRHLQKLVKAGYLRDLTPGRRNAPHVYADTGQAQIIGLVEARVGRTESPTKPTGRTESPTGQDRESYPGRTESPVKIEDSGDERIDSDSLTTENLLPLAVDAHQRHVDQANGGNGTDAVGEVAKHLRWLCSGPGVPLPQTKKARKPYEDAASRLLADTDAHDWRGVGQAIDDWSEHPPEADRWRRERATEPHFALTQIAAHYWRMRNRPTPALVEVPEILPPPPPNPTEDLWCEVLTELETQMPSMVFNTHLLRSRVERNDGTLRVFVSRASAEWLNLHWLDKITAAVRGVDPAVESVEVGT